MKKIFLFSVALAVLFASCRKSDANLDVNLNEYPIDVHASTSDLDKWITQNYTNPWNIQVIYRFDRYYTDVNRNIGSIELNKVRPSLEMVNEGFIKPYVTVTGGTTFGKIYFPKQWVLYGTPSYNTDASYVLGTMSNARQLTLYDLNVLDPANGENIRRRLRTVHHEFMHSLNQTVPIPPDFEIIAGADYDPTWAGKSEAQVRPLGFISPYSSSEYTEDFAEMLAHIVVEGPVWYNNYVLQAGTTGAARLRAKEAILYSYLMNSFNVDLYALQAEVQKQLKTVYNVSDPADVSLGFGYRLAGNRVNTITYDPAATHYTTYGSSAAFTTVFNNYKNAVTAGGRNITNIQFVFTNDSTMVFRANYTNPTSGASLVADYDFKFTINTATNIVTFTKRVPEGTATAHNNGQTTIMLGPFESVILPYLTNRQFVASYLPAGITATNPLYRTFAGFTVNGVSANYFYGPVTYK